VLLVHHTASKFIKFRPQLFELSCRQTKWNKKLSWWWQTCATLLEVSQSQGRRSWRVGGPDPLKICNGCQSILCPPRMSHSFVQNCCCITLSSRMKDMFKKRKVKYFFAAPETDWWLDLTELRPLILLEMYTTDQGHQTWYHSIC